VVASVATTLFLGGWLRPFAKFHELPGFHWLNFLDFVPLLLMVVIGVYFVQRVPKQPMRVQQIFMLSGAGLCFVLGLMLLAPVVVPVAKRFYAGIHGGLWFILKVSLYIYFFMWLRFTIP